MHLCFIVYGSNCIFLETSPHSKCLIYASHHPYVKNKHLKTEHPDLLRFSTSHFCTLAEHLVPLQTVNISNKSLTLHSVEMNTLFRSTFRTRAHFTKKMNTHHKDNEFPSTGEQRKREG